MKGGEVPREGVDVSVIIPVHNRKLMLGRALDSVAEQVEAPAYEVIVVDDGSVDDSGTVARRAGARVLTHPSNLGAGIARNTGIDAAKGTWCAFLDSDDIWSPRHLRVLWSQRHDVDLVGTSGLGVAGRRGRVVGNPSLRRTEVRRPADLLRPENIVNTSATMVRTSALREVGGFRALRYSEDIDLWLRVMDRHPGRILPSITVGCTMHAGQTSVTNPSGMRSGLLEALTSAEDTAAMTPTVRRRLDVAAWWDELRAQRRWPPLREVADHLDLITPLLLRRWVLRHRWRLPSRQALNIYKALLGSEGPHLTAGAIDEVESGRYR